MKVFKNAQILFTLMFITGLVSTGFPWTISGHNVFLQPPEDGDWIISTNEILQDATYIMNGSIEIEPGAKLTILNCDLTFNSTLLDRHKIQVDGELEILNSNISVVDGNYTLTIDAYSQHVASINIEGSRISFAGLKLRYTNITIDQTEIYYSPEIDSISSVFISVTNSEFIDLGDGWDIYNVTTGIFENNDFVNMNFAIDAEKSDNVTIKSNYINEIAEYAIRMKTVQQPIIRDNTIENSVLGMTITSSGPYIYQNTITNASIAMDLISVTKASIEDNIFNEIHDMAIQGVSSSSTQVFDNEFNDLNIGMFLTSTPFETYSNTFNNVTTGIFVFDTDTIEIYENTFNQVSDIAIIIEESQRTEVYENIIIDALRGISIEQGRYNVVLRNSLTGVDEGIAIIGGRQIEVLGNSIEDTVSGIYMEQSKSSIITANTAINATFGISIWSSPEAKIASNGVFESTYGISIWFSELVTLSGNILNTSDIGVVGRNSFNLIIKDGDFRVLNYGVQVIQCVNVGLSGNTFTQIATDAVVVKNSINFNVYDNNFLDDINNIAQIEESLGDFDIIGDNGTIVGNYYVDSSSDVVFITVATYEGKSYDIYDNSTRTTPYQPAPTIEFVTQGVAKPTDIDEVSVETQVFQPQGLEVQVYIEFLPSLVNEFITQDISDTNTSFGSIGSIFSYIGHIPVFAYDYTIIYRIKVNYTTLTESFNVYSQNYSYTVGQTENTPFIINTPRVYYEYINDDNELVSALSTVFFENVEYWIEVSITEREDVMVVEGRRQVNISYELYSPIDDSTNNYSAVMFYNDTSYKYLYEDLGTYVAGTVIKYYITVMDTNGTIHRSIPIHEMSYLPPSVEDAGFEGATLLMIGGLLVFIQTIVVFRRRNRKNEEK